MKNVLIDVASVIMIIVSLAFLLYSLFMHKIYDKMDVIQKNFKVKDDTSKIFDVEQEIDALLKKDLEGKPEFNSETDVEKIENSNETNSNEDYYKALNENIHEINKTILAIENEPIKVNKEEFYQQLYLDLFKNYKVTKDMVESQVVFNDAL